MATNKYLAIQRSRWFPFLSTNKIFAYEKIVDLTYVRSKTDAADVFFELTGPGDHLKRARIVIQFKDKSTTHFFTVGASEKNEKLVEIVKTNLSPEDREPVPYS